MCLQKKICLQAFLILLTGVLFLIIAAGCELTSSPENENDSSNKDIYEEIIYDSITDIDSNVYKTVTIGTQEWTAENLRVSRYNNGDSILGDLSKQEWENTTEGAYSVYPHTGGETESNVDSIDSDEEMVSAYGRLYNWYAVNDDRGLCPKGWHVPTRNEYKQLSDYLVSNYQEVTEDNVGDRLKSRRQIDSPLGNEYDTRKPPRWEADDTHYGTDNFGFSALPGGFRESYGIFNGLGYGGYYWSSTELMNSNSAFGWVLLFNDGGVIEDGGTKMAGGFCIRCIRD